MKPVCILLCLLMVSQTLTQHTTNSEQQIKQDLSMEILHELKETSRTFRLYLNKMNAMEEKINSIEEKVESMHSQYTEQLPCNCLELMRKNSTINGVYTIYLHENRYAKYPKQIQVYCDMETDSGGWLVFQRRTDGSENFYRQWFNYRNGFGDLKNEFWLGNEDLFQILNTCDSGKQHEMRIDLEDFSNEKRYAKYSTFDIGSSADNYTLTVGGYSGNAGDAMAYHNGYQFSTYDNDVTPRKCAQLYKGAWWYQNCYNTNLNGLYSNNATSVGSQGVTWNQWKGERYSLKFTEMKIRPKQ